MTKQTALYIAFIIIGVLSAGVIWFALIDWLREFGPRRNPDD